MSFADVGSTSGWLIPTFWFKSQGIDPKTYFQYHEGSTHPANEMRWRTDNRISRPTSIETARR